MFSNFNFITSPAFFNCTLPMGFEYQLIVSVAIHISFAALGSYLDGLFNTSSLTPFSSFPGFIIYE